MGNCPACSRNVGQPRSSEFLDFLSEQHRCKLLLKEHFSSKPIVERDTVRKL